MRVTRRFVTFAATLALAAPGLLQVSRLSAQSSEEAAVLQAVEALTKAMLDADRARYNAIVRHMAAVDYEDGGKAGSTKIGVLQVWVKQDGRWKLLARQAFRS
jgi:hypothetical protein